MTRYFFSPFVIGISYRRGRKKLPQRRVLRHRLNDRIVAQKLRVVDEMGELIGVMSRDEALTKAQEMEKDLVEISPKADPPVAKIIDYGKMLYQLKKKEQQQKSAGKAKEMKGIRLTFRIGPGDLERQRGKAEGFLVIGHPVKVQLVMRGREKAHKDLALDKMRSFLKSLDEVASVDQVPRSAGFQIVSILQPKGKTKATASDNK